MLKSNNLRTYAKSMAMLNEILTHELTTRK